MNRDMSSRKFQIKNKNGSWFGVLSFRNHVLSLQYKSSCKRRTMNNWRNGAFAGTRSLLGYFSFRIYIGMFLPKTIYKVSIISSSLKSVKECLHDKNCPALPGRKTSRQTFVPYKRNAIFLQWHLKSKA